MLNKTKKAVIQFKWSTAFVFNMYGGAERDRTDDLLLARQALSQLSYSPIQWRTLTDTTSEFQQEDEST